MIIQDITSTRGFLFFKPKLVLKTDKKIVTYPIELTLEQTQSLQRLKGISLTTFQDFSKISQTLENKPLLRILQLTALSSEPFSFNTDVKQIPRPMHTLGRKNNGIEFYALSLNAATFEKAVLANHQLKNHLTKIDINLKNEEDILKHLQEGIKSVQTYYDFEIKLGVHFNSTSTTEEVLRLLTTFNLVYVEGAVTNEQEYEQLKPFEQTTFIAVSPEIYSSFKTNAAILTFLPLEQLAALRTSLSTNLFYNLQEGEEYVPVSLKIPIVKIPLEEKKMIETLIKIKEELKPKN